MAQAQATSPFTASQALGAIRFLRDKLNPDDHAAFVDLLHQLCGGEGEDQMTGGPAPFNGAPERGGGKVRLPGQPGPDGMIRDLPPAMDSARALRAREEFARDWPQVAKIPVDTMGIQAEPSRKSGRPNSPSTRRPSVLA